MRVHIYKLEKGGLAVLVEPSQGRGLAPVLLEGVTRGNIAARVLPVIEQVRSPRLPDTAPGG